MDKIFAAYGKDTATLTNLFPKRKLYSAFSREENTAQNSFLHNLKNSRALKESFPQLISQGAPRNAQTSTEGVVPATPPT